MVDTAEVENFHASQALCNICASCTFPEFCIALGGYVHHSSGRSPFINAGKVTSQQCERYRDVLIFLPAMLLVMTDSIDAEQRSETIDTAKVGNFHTVYGRVGNGAEI
jgi:hypothetical protein